MKFDFNSSNPQCSMVDFIAALNKTNKPFSAVTPRIYPFELEKTKNVCVILLSDPRRIKRKKTFQGFIETEDVTLENFTKKHLKVFSVYETHCLHLKTITRKEKIEYSINPYNQTSFLGSSFYNANIQYSRLLIGDKIYVIRTYDAALYTLPNRHI